MDNKCPYCGADTRPGDNFCLNCGNRLPSVIPSQQAQTVTNDATLAAEEDWAASPGAVPAHSWSEAGAATVADSNSEPTSYQTEAAVSTMQATMDKIEQPAHVVLRAETGEVVQEYPLDKFEMSIGRAPNSDILLSKDKLTSRRHATVHYENGQYVLRDERSANGTFVNGQQLDEMKPYVLQDGDQIGIGEHELTFRASGSAAAPAVEDLPTIAVSPSEVTYRTQGDENMTAASADDFGTKEEMEVEQPEPVLAQVDQVSSPSEPISSPAPSLPEPEVVPATPAPVESVSNTPLPAYTDENVNLSHFTGLPMPTLPDMTSLMAALSTLDGQVTSLQEQLNATQDNLRNHEAELARTTSQLRTGLRRVSERMDNTIADVARSREALAWAELLQLMEDVMNNPRDIEYVTKMARKARELNKVFQLHQNVLNTMAECNSLLRSMIGEDR